MAKQFQEAVVNCQNDRWSREPGNSGGGHELPKTGKIPKQATGGLPVAAGQLAASNESNKCAGQEGVSNCSEQLGHSKFGDSVMVGFESHH